MLFLCRAPCTTVIGVAEDAAYQSVTDEQRFVYYLSADQMGSGWAGRIYIRLAGRPTASELERVRSAMQTAMPGNGFVVVRPLQEAVDDQSRSWRLGATLFVAFGGLAVVVAAVGLYGVIGYTVAQRMHELGMRIALGAQSGHIVQTGAEAGYRLCRWRRCGRTAAGVDRVALDRAAALQAVATGSRQCSLAVYCDHDRGRRRSRARCRRSARSARTRVACSAQTEHRASRVPT